MYPSPYRLVDSPSIYAHPHLWDDSRLKDCFFFLTSSPYMTKTHTAYTCISISGRILCIRIAFVSFLLCIHNLFTASTQPALRHWKGGQRNGSGEKVSNQSNLIRVLKEAQIASRASNRPIAITACGCCFLVRPKSTLDDHNRLTIKPVRFVSGWRRHSS